LKIGLFDSGIGGITVLRKLLNRYAAHYIYLADTARAPYGIKSRDMMAKISAEIIGFMEYENVDHVVAACNTTDSFLSDIAGGFDFPYHSIINSAVSGVTGGRVAVIATDMTVKSGIYMRKLAEKRIEVQQRACQLFVSLVEEGITYGRMAEAVAKFYLNPLKRYCPDTLILGCTHFPLLNGVIHDIMNESRLLDPADVIAKDFPYKEGNSVVEFYITGDPGEFQNKLKKIGFKYPYIMYKLPVAELERRKYSLEGINSVDRAVGGR
jgi:glutamate racemase